MKTNLTWSGLLARNLLVTVSPSGSRNRRLETGSVHSDPGSAGRWSIRDNRCACKQTNKQTNKYMSNLQSHHILQYWIWFQIRCSELTSLSWASCKACSSCSFFESSSSFSCLFFSSSCAINEVLNPLIPNIHIQILNTDLHKCPWQTSWENLLDKTFLLRWSFY